MRPDSAVPGKSPPARAGVLAMLLATLSLSVAATTANAQQSGDQGIEIESEYFTDEADAGFFDFNDDDDVLDRDVYDEEVFDDDFGDDDGFVDLDEEMFNYDAEYGQDYDDQLVSDEFEYEFPRDDNAFETDEAWFEDWFDA